MKVNVQSPPGYFKMNLYNLTDYTLNVYNSIKAWNYSSIILPNNVVFFVHSIDYWQPWENNRVIFLSKETALTVRQLFMYLKTSQFCVMCTVFVDWSLTIYYKFNLVKFNQQKLYWGRSKLIGLLQAATRSGSASHFLECALLKHFNTFFSLWL